jgi:hypothetical protein
MAMAAVRASAVSTSASGAAFNSREHRLALQGVAKRPVFAPERRGGSRHAGGKGAAMAILPAPPSLDALLVATAEVLTGGLLFAFRPFHPRLARAPPLLLS